MIEITWYWTVIAAWAFVCTGFVMGAAWCGLGVKNKIIDEEIARRHRYDPCNSCPSIKFNEDK